ncbi:MAG: NAD(P)-dependent oxidoreductase [Salinirussus sp.]
MVHALVDPDIQPVDHLKQRVGDRFTVEVTAAPDRDTLIDRLQDADLILTTSRHPIDRTVMEQTNLRLIGKFGTGVDSIDLEAAADLGIPVTHTPGLNAKAVAEYTVMLALAASRHLLQNVRLLERGGWRDESASTGQVTDRTVGIVGFGRIGQRVAGLLSGFNVDVLASDPYVFEEDTDITGAELTDLDDLLSRSDVVTINAELTPETRGLIGADELALLSPDAYLVNTARGPIVDEDALVAALERGDLAGAALDVFETEPLPADSRLHGLDNVVATPHVAAMTKASRVRSVDRLIDNVIDLLDGEPVADRYMAVPA